MEKKRLLAPAKRICLVLLILTLIVVPLFATACGEEEVTPPGEEEEEVTPPGEEEEEEPAQVEVEWRIAHFAAEEGACYESMVWWAEQMEQRTNGRFKATFYWAAQLGNWPEYVEGLQSGLYEAACVACAYVPSQFPVENTLDLFYVEDNQEYTELIFALWENPLSQAEWAQFNIKPLVPVNYAHYEIVSHERITTADDFRGIRMRGPYPRAKAFEVLGSVLVEISGPEVYGALERQIIDATLFTVDRVVARKMWEVADYYISNSQVGTVHHVLACSENAWDQLPQDMKEIHEEVTRDFIAQFAPTQFVEELAACETALRENFKECIVLSDEEAEKIWLAGVEGRQEWISDLEEAGIPGQDLWDFLVAKYAELVSK